MNEYRAYGRFKIKIALQAQEIVDALLRRRLFSPVPHPEIWSIRLSLI
jgi:hypothetical protein